MHRPAAFALAAMLLAGPAPAAEMLGGIPEVDLQLVLAADASGSIGGTLGDAQRRGFAAAFRDPALQRAATSGPTGRIAVTYVEWSGRRHQHVVAPWTVLSSPGDMARFADTIEAAGNGIAGGETSISGAMLFALGLFETSGVTSYRKVVDISGNGRNSEGPGVATALDALVATGAVVNGLALPAPAVAAGDPFRALFHGYDGPLVDYYRSEVIGGPGAFAIEVDPADGFGRAILRKLVLEVAWAEPEGVRQ